MIRSKRIALFVAITIFLAGRNLYATKWFDVSHLLTTRMYLQRNETNQTSNRAKLNRNIAVNRIKVPNTDCPRYMPKIPSFILAGAQKAGTTALYFLLEKMRDINPSIAFEPHFFDQRGQLKRNASALTDDDICSARENYLTFWENNGTFPEGQLGFEKTPVYMCKPTIPALVKTVTPWAKVIIMLRNPVERAFSGYKMMYQRTQDLGEFTSMEDLIDSTMRILRDNQLSSAPLFSEYIENTTKRDDFALRDPLRPSMLVSYDRLLMRGIYSRQIVNWLQYFELDVDLKVILYEDFARDPGKVLNDILAFVGSPPHKLTSKVLEDAYRPTRGIKRNFSGTLAPKTREYLELFYRPYNDELVDLLGEEWRGVWR